MINLPKTNTLSLAVKYRGQHKLEVVKEKIRYPKANEVILRIAYCGICGSDIHIFHGNMDKRVGFDRILGHELSGVVIAVGKEVKYSHPNLHLGQKATVRPIKSCEKCPACLDGYPHVCHNLNCLGVDSDGGMREFWTLPAKFIYPLPDTLSLMHAALTEPVAVACHSVRLSHLKPEEHVLVIGAGTIGILIALIAQKQGGRVIISEVNPHRIRIAKKIGFTVINSNEVDLLKEITEHTQGQGAQVVFEVSGTSSGVENMTLCAASRAKIMMVAIHVEKPQVDLFQVFRRELQIIGTRIQEPEDFLQAIKLLNSGVIDPNTVITDIHPLKDISRVFEKIDHNPTSLKTVIEFTGESEIKEKPLFN